MTKWTKNVQIFNAFLALSYLNGFLLSLQFVKSQAYFLTHYPAKMMVFVLFIPLLAWYGISILIQKKINSPKLAQRISPWLLLIGILLTLSSFFANKSPIMIIIWIFISGIYADFFRWFLLELQERYINPSKVGTLYSYQSMSNEIGLLTGLLILYLFPNFNLIQLTTLTWSILLIKMFLVLITFYNPRILEIHHMKDIPTSSPSLYYKNPIYKIFLLLGVCFGVYKASQDTLINSYFQTFANDRVQIQIFISKALFLGSFLQILSSYINGRLVERFRISPIRTLQFSWLIYFFLGIICISLNEIWSYILMLSLSKGFAGVYFPTSQRISGAYDSEKRIHYRAAHFWGSVAITSIIFYFIPANFSVLITTLTFSILCTLIILQRLNRYHTLDLQKMILSKNLTQSIRAAIGLSYLKPPNYFEKMSRILDKKPHQLLKKQILLGIGHLREEKSTDRLIQEFNSDKEEIQMTIIEAMRFSASNKATKFALDLVLSNKKTLTPRVRLNASQIIAALYGEKSIPILMLGLQEDDPRMVANVIEALSQFRSQDLIEVYQKYTHSNVPRVRANALIALLKYPSYKNTVIQEITSTLQSPDQIGEKTSIFYVIGKHKVQFFKQKLLHLHSHIFSKIDDFQNIDSITLSYLQTLSWALLRLGSTKGYESLFQLIQTIKDPQKIKSILHFYIQLEDTEKFDCIDIWLLNSKDKTQTKQHLLEIFSNSGFDFTEEISYLNSLRWTEKLITKGF